VDHWFDAFAKRIAQVQPSRRTALATLAASAWMFGVRTAHTQTLPMRGCTRAYQGDALVQRAVGSEAGITFQHSVSFDRNARRGFVDVVALWNGELLVSAHAETNAQGAPSVELRYGEGVDGVRRATVEIGEWRVLQGKVDGRSFLAPEHAQSMEDATFTDGRPRPRVQVGSEPREALRRASASAANGACRTAPVVDEASPQTLPARFVRREPRPQGGGRAAHPNRIQTCDPCLDACAQAAECVGALPAMIDTIFDVPAWSARAAACVVRYAECAARCYAIGGGCCPTDCGGGACCGRGESCMDGRGGGCCPTGRAVCSGHCCGPGVDTCAPDGYCGCPHDHTLCGEDCCAPDQVCCGGVRCCSPEGCQSGLC
jgi:hypothetical protein